MIEQKLLLVEALARGYADRPEVMREVFARETELLVSRYLEEVVSADRAECIGYESFLRQVPASEFPVVT